MKAIGSKLAAIYRDNSSDSYIYTYACGHSWNVPMSSLVVSLNDKHSAPPICPTCHGQKAIDIMEADNWRVNPEWDGYTKEIVADAMSGVSNIGTFGGLAWLEAQIGLVRRKAWL